MTRARDVANLIGSGNYSSTTFTATAGQTAFTISHTQGFIQVFMNGLLLDETVDYTSNGSAVTLTSGAAAGDEIEVVAYNTFSVGNAMTQTSADTRYVNTTGDTMTGTLVAGTRLQVGDSSITQAYPQTNFGYVADFQASSGTQTYISIAAPQASSLGDTGIVIGEDATDTYITQRGNKNIKLATQDLIRLVVDGSGRVTLPYQPMFDAYMSGNYTTGSSGVYNLSTSANWGNRANTGGHFVNNTGTFTAPVAGKYLFVAGISASSYPTSAYLSCEFEVNGSRKYIHWFSNYGTSYAAANNSAIINLSANDYVRLVSETHVSASFIGHSSGIYSHFGGMLIG